MRLKPDDRYNQILDAAVRVAERTGYRSLKREDVAAFVTCVEDIP